MDIFPTIPGLTWNIKKAFTTKSLAAESASAVSYRIGQWSPYSPIVQFHLEYAYLRDPGFPSGNYDERKKLLGFFQAQNGSVNDFLFLDQDDNGGLGQPLQVFVDGAGVSYSPLQYVLGATLSNPGWMDVTDLVPLSQLDPGNTPVDLNVYDNNVWKQPGTDYVLSSDRGLAIYTADALGNTTGSLSFDGLYITWLTTPVGPVKADFKLYFRVHFATYSGSQRQSSQMLDAIEVNNFLAKLYEARTVEFESSRATKLQP